MYTGVRHATFAFKFVPKIYHVSNCLFIFIYIYLDEGSHWLNLTRKGKHGDAFRRSSMCNLPPHCMATPTPCIGRLREEPTLSGPQADPTICPTPSHQEVCLPSGFLHKRLCRHSMVRYILLCKHLLAIPLMVLVPNNTASAWDRPRRGHLRSVKIPRP